MSRRDNFIQHARGTPFDIVGTSLRKDNLQETIEELRKQTVYDPTSTATTASGDLNLTSASSTLHFLTGSAIGFDVNLPNATTLFNGQNYIIVNESTASVSIKNSAGTQIFELLADAIAVVFLQDNTVSAGVWVGYVVSGFATGILSYNLITSTPFTTTSTTDVVITGYSITPVAGTYAVWYNASVLYTTTPRYHYWSIYKAGVQVTDSLRSQITSRSNQGLFDATQSVINVNGSQALDIRVRCDASGGSLTVNARSLTLIRLGP